MKMCDMLEREGDGAFCFLRILRTDNIFYKTENYVTSAHQKRFLFLILMNDVMTHFVVRKSCEIGTF